MKSNFRDCSHLTFHKLSFVKNSHKTERPKAQVKIHHNRLRHHIFLLRNNYSYLRTTETVESSLTHDCVSLPTTIPPRAKLNCARGQPYLAPQRHTMLLDLTPFGWLWRSPGPSVQITGSYVALITKWKRGTPDTESQFYQS